MVAVCITLPMGSSSLVQESLRNQSVHSSGFLPPRYLLAENDPIDFDVICLSGIVACFMLVKPSLMVLTAYLCFSLGLAGPERYSASCNIGFAYSVIYLPISVRPCSASGLQGRTAGRGWYM